ncbi:sulfate adenylyltransferase subunit CysD [Alphaproteobacteria bacterium]|nr:sulfate adenylyltransferase subunit CysD [Alphaproteobacteria bacterium]
MKFQPGIVYTTKSIASYIYGSEDTAALKRAERWIVEKSLNFNCLKAVNISDEHNRPAKKQVMAHIIDQHKVRRNVLLFVQKVSTIEGKTFLFTNDAKGARRWIQLDGQKKVIESIETALQTLLEYENKNTVIIPGGCLTTICRELSRKWRSNEKKINGKIIHLALEVFHHALSDIDAYVNKDIPLKGVGKLTHLDLLEAEAIYIMREVAAEAVNPVMLYSLGKDSSVMLHLAKKAFYPSKPPFPLLHIDTRWKFQAMYDFRDHMAKTSGIDLIVYTNPEGIERNINPIDHGSALHTDIMKTAALKQVLDVHKFDIAIGGARRDEEKSRAKERIFSFRTSTHQWDPKNQRPELWRLFNLHKKKEESIRAFPLSNWTEMDIWQYIYREQIPIIPLYFATERPVVERDGMLIMLDDDRLELLSGENIKMKRVRFRSLGCYPLTAAIESVADSLELILLELLNLRDSERQGRTIDKDSSASMEKKKQEGYF